MKFNRLSVVLVLLFSIFASSAQLFKVDINGAARSDTTAPGYVKWDVPSTYVAGTGNQVAMQSFTNYTITYDPDSNVATATNINLIIRCVLSVVSPVTNVSTIYLNGGNGNKNGNSTSTDPNSGWRLATDAAWIHEKNDAITVDRPYTNGAAFSLTISNLPAGEHTITTYHNDVWGASFGGLWHSNNVLSHCIIRANGTPVFTNVPTYYVTNDSKCGFSFFTISNSYDGQPLVLNFDPDHSSSLDFVLLNGFEVDRPSPPGTIPTAVFPVPGDEHAAASNDVAVAGSANAGFLNLQWVPAGFAISNYVYFGTSVNAVTLATNGSPEFKAVTAAITLNNVTNIFGVTNLNSALTYYWRVDQLDIANGATNLVKGDVWSFRTRHLSFPTAEGYGRFARGGRGGRVIEVTNLNDSGPGSYRAAVQATGPRTVVFKVSGLIRLLSPCVISANNSYLTIAGQTAPGEGICLANWRAGMSSCNDVNMRFVRCRLGDASKQAMDGIGLGNSTHSIIDHCSVSWTLDEASSSRQSGAVGSQSAMITFQHNIISEPLQHSYHYNDAERAATGCTNCYQAHAFAASISGEIGSYHHNLIAHSTDRNWSLAGGLDQSQHYAGSLDIRNNVVFNWTSRTTDGGVQRCTYVSNYYKPYNPNNPQTYLLKLDTLVPVWGNEWYYMVGNVMEGKNYMANNWANGGFQNGASVQAQVQTNAEIFPSFILTQSATNAYKLVLSDSGCNMPVPDAIDVRIVGEVIDGKVHYKGTNGNPYVIDGVVQDTPSANIPGIIDSQNDVLDYTNDVNAANYSPNAPWGPYRTFNVPTDSDHDGLPDWWENILGTNPNSPADDFSDSNADPDGDGYTRLEDYLNWLAGIHYECLTNGTLDVDLTQFTRGFTNWGPTYVVSLPTNGTVSLTGTKIAHFTPTGTEGLGRFQFKVTDSSGFSYTNVVGIHITSGVIAGNTAPVLPVIANRTVNVGVTVNFTNNATDADVPAQTLTYSLTSGPTNAAVGGASGVFSWRPLATQADTTNLTTVVVTDNGSPSMSATQSFNVIINPLSLPSVASMGLSGGQFGLLVNGQVGPDYAVQGSSNLVDWSTLIITNPVAMPFSWNSTNSALPMQFYRIKIGPPLP